MLKKEKKSKKTRRFGFTKKEIVLGVLLAVTVGSYNYVDKGIQRHKSLAQQKELLKYEVALNANSTNIIDVKTRLTSDGEQVAIDYLEPLDHKLRIITFKPIESIIDGKRVETTRNPVVGYIHILDENNFAAGLKRNFKIMHPFNMQSELFIDASTVDSIKPANYDDYKNNNQFEQFFK